MQREVREQEPVGATLSESRQRWRAIFDNSLDPILLANDDARYVEVNPAACQLLGYRRDELLQMSVWDITPGSDRIQGQHAWAAFLAQGVLAGEYTVLRKDGSTREVEFKAVAHVQSNLHLSILRDITERKRVEAERAHLLAELKKERAQLKALTATLEQRVNERTEQVRNLASELALAEQRERHRIAQVLHDDTQQMLVALQMNIQLIGEQATPETRSQLKEAAALTNEVIDGLRDLSIELRPPVIGSESMADIFTWLAGDIEKKYGLGVDLIVEGAGRVADEDRRELIVRLARELLFNVVKHAGVDRAWLRVQEQGNALAISVEDDGNGFDVAVMTEKRAEGKGFGLYSVSERARLFGGELEISSAPGAGTRATLTIPLMIDA